VKQSAISSQRSAPPGVEAELEERRRLVEDALQRAFPPESAWPETIHRAVRYSLLAGGKRIRPLLALASGEAVGGRRDEVMPLACAVEMIHTYSLVHDDLPAMDDDDLRRGQPTSHKVFGEAVAILAGDALLTRAFQMMAEAPADAGREVLARRLAATAILAEAAGTTGMIGGQVMDLESEGRALDAPALETMHRAKTGALLGACVRGGAVLGGGGGEDRARLDRYASAIGLAFQVVDDVLDETGAAHELGKTAGKDARAGKATYVSVHGLDASRRLARRLLEEALSALAPLGARGRLLEALARMIVERRA
jgi:geranylgeranyl diphosphate synthase, type II